MHKNEYLYGKDIEVPQVDGYIIARRLELLDDHLTDLLNVNYMERDLARIRAVEKAKNFWRRLGEIDD